MIRRLQLLEPESRFSMRRVAAVGNRIRDSLLHGNKVIPSVLAVLALLIFTWLAAGAFMGGPGEQRDEEEVSNQASLAQGPENPESQDSGAPAPGVEDRDADSFAKFRSKDPFRDIIPEAGETTRANDGGDRNGGDGNGRDRDGGSRNGGDRDGEDRGEDFIDQSFPAEDSGGRPGDDGGDAGEGVDRDAGSGQDGGVGRGGNGGLFDSGGNLSPWGF